MSEIYLHLAIFYQIFEWLRDVTLILDYKTN